MVTGRRLEVLCRTIIAAATHPTDGGADLCMEADCTGAHLVHALLVANTPPSLAVAMGIYRHRPRLLLQEHTSGPFLGEHGLHILAVNRKHACP